MFTEGVVYMDVSSLFTNKDAMIIAKNLVKAISDMSVYLRFKVMYSKSNNTVEHVKLLQTFFDMRRIEFINVDGVSDAVHTIGKHDIVLGRTSFIAVDERHNVINEPCIIVSKQDIINNDMRYTDNCKPIYSKKKELAEYILRRVALLSPMY